MNDTILQPFDGLFDCPWREGLGGLFVVVLGEQLTRLGKQHRENQSGSHDHNRPDQFRQLVCSCFVSGVGG
jgi:hypothetical protein